MKQIIQPFLFAALVFVTSCVSTRHAPPAPSTAAIQASVTKATASTQNARRKSESIGSTLARAKANVDKAAEAVPAEVKPVVEAVRADIKAAAIENEALHHDIEDALTSANTAAQEVATLQVKVEAQTATLTATEGKLIEAQSKVAEQRAAIRRHYFIFVGLLALLLFYLFGPQLAAMARRFIFPTP